MGREYRLSRDPRLREKGGRRPARVSPALPVDGSSVLARGGDFRPASVRTLHVASGTALTIAGVDVGEDYLDIALLKPNSRYLKLTQVPVAGIDLERNSLA